MTDKFTPPTTFPHECILDFSGEKVTLIGRRPSDPSVFVYELEGGGINSAYCSAFEEKPKVVSTWQNVYSSHNGLMFDTRAQADIDAKLNRINVLRRDTINGVTTCALEDV